MIDRINQPRVLDTSAIVQDPSSLLAYEDDVYICLTVLEELDSLKERHDRSVSADARVCIRMLEDLIGDSTAEDMEKGIVLPSSGKERKGKLFIGVDTKLEMVEELRHDLGSKADNRIINYALNLQKKLDQKVSIVSRDINMRLKARVVNINSEDVPLDGAVADVDMLYTGVQHFKGSIFDGVQESGEDLKCDKKQRYTLARNIFNEECQVNMYWYDDEGNSGRIVSITDNEVITQFLPKSPREIWGIKPKNERQEIALDQLTSEEFDLNIILGPAGSGKTYLAMAAALEMVVERKKYKKIIVVRSRDFMDDDPGFLPGDIKDKSMPLMGGVTDALTSMHADDAGDGTPDQKIAHIIEKANIEFASLAYVRGRSVDDAVFFIDESQNLTRAQVKGVLSRGGKNCRTIMVGNLAQIDDRFISASSSGLNAAVNTYRKYSKGSVLIFDKVERSSLASFTEENF